MKRIKDIKKVISSPDNREIVKRGILAAISLVLLVALAFAWFTNVRTNEGNIAELNSVDPNNVRSALYHLIYDQNGELISEEPVTELIITNFVPNQTECYRLEISNVGGIESTVAVTIINVNADFTVPVGEPQPDIELAKVIELADVYVTGNTPPAVIHDDVEKISDDELNGETLFNLYTEGENTDTNVRLIQNVVVPPSSTGSVYFKFHMIKEANNYYQYKIIKIEGIEIVKS